MLASPPLLLLPSSAPTHSPVCLFSPCSASSSLSPLSLAGAEQREGAAPRLLPSPEMDGSCHLQSLLPWHTLESGNLGPAAADCTGGSGGAVPVACAAVIPHMPVGAFLQQHCSISSAPCSLLTANDRKHFLFSEENRIRSSLLAAAAEGIEHKPLLLMHMSTPGADPGRNPHAFT